MQELAAPGVNKPLFISAVESLSGIGPRALMALDRADLSGAANPLTLGEIAALQEDYSSDSDASTILLERDVSPVPEWSPAAVMSSDPIFGFAEPIVVSPDVPTTVPDVTNPVDRLIQREKDRKLMMSSLSHPIARVNVMDLMDIRYQLNQLCRYVKNQVPALCPISRLTPAPGKIVDPHLGMSLPVNKVSNICWLLDSLS